MKNLVAEPPLKKSAHLKSNAAFEWVLWREIAIAGICVVAASLNAGTPFILTVGVVLAVVVLGKGLFHISGLSVASRTDLSLFHQALLVCLFLPPLLSIKAVALAAIALVLFYFVCGGRMGYVLQPVCLTLAALLVFKSKVGFQLENLSMVSAGIILVLALAIRFPKTLIEFQRMLFIFGAGIFLCLLKEMNGVTAILCSVVIGELIFDPKLAPLSKRGRLIYQSMALVLFALLLIATPWCEAFILTGLLMSFISGWIEQQSIVSKVYIDAKKN